jgi:phosphate-selective porin
MRLQAQFANLNTDIQNAPDPVATSHFFLRRAYLTLKAGLGAGWSTVFTYDFAGSSYDDAILEWKPTNDLTFDFGLRKVNLAFEERGSSGDIKSIERSPVTRYFVEANNGRRLGAASYRIGGFLDGKKDIEGGKYTFLYSAAVTNPERADTFTIASATGDNTSNNLAYFGNVGFSGKFTGGNYLVGVGAGFLPDQGGASNTNLGKGFDLTLYSVYSSLTYGKFGFRGEYLMAKVEGGLSATQDAKPSGYYLEPAYLITDKIEAVFRYSQLDTDHRGVNLSDGVRSAPGGGTMNKLTEYFVGGNWYIKSNDLKFQLGFVYGKTSDTVTGAAAEAKVYGIRSQLQTNF